MSHPSDGVERRSIERPYPELVLIQGDPGQHNPFEEVKEFITAEAGDLFWGITTEQDGKPVPATIVNRLEVIQSAYHFIPDDLLTWRDEDWRDEPVVHKPRDMEHLFGRISAELPAQLGKKHPKAPRTNEQAYDHPGLRNLLLERLVGEQYIPAIMHRLFEQYESVVSPTDRMRTLGYTALKHYLFMAGGNTLLAELQAANRQLHQ